MTRTEQPHLPGTQLSRATPQAVSDAFDAARLTQARVLKAMTKREVAQKIGVSPAAIGQYETGSSRPRPHVVPKLAEVLDVPIEFFLAGRPHGKIDASMANFRSLRSTRSFQREKATGYVGQVWELTYALERYVQLPPVDLPGFSGGEIHPGTDLPREPDAAAAALRRRWELGTGPIRHLVRQMEARGIVVVAPVEADPGSPSVDAFSTCRLPRPIVVLTPNRSDDVYRYRFSAAHELGHLVLHADGVSGDAVQEREADAFAAAFLTPNDSIRPDLPHRIDFTRLAELQRVWGVSVSSLVYRSRELGLVSDATVSRAYQRLHRLKGQTGFRPEPITGFPGEQPSMLRKAFELACNGGLSLRKLAKTLAWKPERVAEILGVVDSRPVLRLVE
ncbi:helix-turn-helix domain-containing protein [Streptomonospora salina]|uniref:Zn-dependent peptidase ImmA (M78 family)/transcriptional regulator with XRE-family HTH domain n=1 Tax=Streptomonospora salina TaxID=104205 RepID=A0A841ED87_9ACTN|nr:XRE family transcriptional regulator [Streptomonospora salina]MBB5998420.1 Zn-dependent peptidase ImmA (M78 family)/transcriptional regulator with XRE-family HTH domain [Streptomonospora salina]